MKDYLDFYKQKLKISEKHKKKYIYISIGAITALFVLLFIIAVLVTVKQDRNPLNTHVDNGGGFKEDLVCGDGVCSPNEMLHGISYCDSDCQDKVINTCGNGICEESAEIPENKQNCEVDC